MAENNIIPGINAATGVIGTASQILGIGEKRQDKRQVEQQEKLQKLGIKGSKELADYEQKLQYDMWEKTNYKAQMEQLTKAGLNPGLVYGMSGGGGATTGGASTGGVTGGVAANAAATQEANTGMAMMGAQIRVLETQAKKNEAEAEKISGVDTIESQTRSREANQRIFISEETAENIIGKALWEAEKTKEEYRNEWSKAYVNERTKDDQVKQIQAEAIGSLLENILTESKTEINKVEVKAIGERIAQGWTGLKQNELKLAIDQFKADIEANYPGVTKVIGRGIDDFVEMLFKGREQRKGFQKENYK